MAEYNSSNILIGDKNVPIVNQLKLLTGKSSFELQPNSTRSSLESYLKDAIARNVGSGNTVVPTRRFLNKVTNKTPFISTDLILSGQSITSPEKWILLCESVCRALIHKFNRDNFLEIQLDIGNLYVINYSGYVCTVLVPKTEIVTSYYSHGFIGPLLAKIVNKLGFILNHTGLYLMDKGDPIQIGKSLGTGRAVYEIFAYNMDSAFEYKSTSPLNNYNNFATSKFFNKSLFENYEVEDEYLKVLGITHEGLAEYFSNRVSVMSNYVYPDVAKPLELLSSTAGSYLYRDTLAMLESPEETYRTDNPKFNSEIIKNLLGVELPIAKKLLGEFKTSFKNDDKFELFINSSMQSTLNSKFKEFYENKYGSVKLTSETTEIVTEVSEQPVDVSVLQVSMDLPIPEAKPKRKRKNSKAQPTDATDTLFTLAA